MTEPESTTGAQQPYRVDYGDSEPHRHALAQALAADDITVEQLWLRAFALGGEAGPADLAAYLEGLMPLPTMERDVLAQAMNERIAEVGPSAVPYSRELEPPRPTTGPLAALVGLLEGGRYCPPEQLSGIVDRAAQAMGLRGAAIFLADHEQYRLTAMRNGESDGAAQFPVEGSLAGRAFQTGETIPALNDPPPRYWVPILDGDERLGVLEVVLDRADQVVDPSLREQCQWLAALLGHLIASLDAHGDRIDRLRRSGPRSAGAELIWSLLPPLTAGVGGFVVSGLLAPADDLGGDIFDYALSETSVSLAVFDAMGHGLRAGLIAAAAVSAYRAARKAGHDLLAQAALIDQTVAATFPDAYVTAVLIELDLGSGDIDYVNAGHPEPLLLRAGTVVTTLDGGRRLPLGLNADLGVAGDLVLGGASLQPGDCLALYTDGVTEARALNGAFFGDARLVDYLERAASSNQSPPETARRLLHAVLDHQDGVLQDDATLLLARWGARP
ncbi:PP2C family protein-serine/threonine phosphatase [Nocardioides dongkuii]|uniref:PP2C family protein-serine/threonine phosphatase n=1 Tax=Nocardioides dongkuii TaxID=2760089 RepID=UPI0018781567|nr:SpoIIE family protein phosphatase [Nocardioides dongkuii]